jgi:hypothetical protein
MTYLTLFDRRKLFLDMDFWWGGYLVFLGGSIKKHAYHGNGV